MLSTSLFSQDAGVTVWAVALRYCGFTARMATSDEATAESFESWTVAFSSSRKTLLLASEMSNALMCELGTIFLAMNPCASAGGWSGRKWSAFERLSPRPGR